MATRKTPAFMPAAKSAKPAKGKNPFAGRESAAEEAAEKKKFPGKKAYAKAESQFEGEGMKCGGKVKKMACGGKAKRYADGGVTEGPNANIDDDVRARALRAVRAAQDDGEQVAEPMSTARLEGRALPPAARASRPAADKPAPARKVAEYSPKGATPFDPSNVNPAAVGMKTAAPVGADRSVQTAGAVRKAERAADEIRAAAKMRPEAQALEGSYPEALLAGPARAGIGAAARGIRGAASGMAKAPTAAQAEIGTRVARTADEVMEARAAAASKAAADAARVAPKRDLYGASRNSPMRKIKKSDTQESRGEYLAKGGAVRGTGAAKRGFGRGKMC